jgi:hypothetical protein
MWMVTLNLSPTFVVAVLKLKVSGIGHIAGKGGAAITGMTLMNIAATSRIANIFLILSIIESPFSFQLKIVNLVWI